MEMGRSAITGVDGLGQEIRKPDDPAYKQFEQTLASEFAGLEPISIAGDQQIHWFQGQNGRSLDSRLHPRRQVY